MGAFGAVGGALTKGLAEGADKVLGSAYEKMSDSSAGRGAIDLLWAMGRSFSQHPTGPVVKGMVDKGMEAHENIVAQELAPVHAFQAAVRRDPKLALKFNYKTTSLADIHSTLKNESHPAAAHLTPLMADTSNHGVTIPGLETKAEAKAMMYAREAAFGPKGINLAATLYPMLKSENPKDRTLAMSWQRSLSQVFRDTQNIPNRGVSSGIKSDVATSVNRMERQYGTKGGDLSTFDVSPEYTPANKFERVAGSYAMNYLAPFIFIAHLADFFKLPATVPARALMKTAMSLNDKDLSETVTASGIFSHTLHSIYHDDFEFRTGMISNTTKSPGLGAILNKLFHTPGFNNLRLFQLRVMGTAAYHSAQMWGKQAVHGNSRALIELGAMGLDTNKIIQRGGELTEEELQHAVFHFTNDKLFINRPLDRSFLAGSGPFFRVASMFHGYVARERQLMTRELSKLMKAQDYLGIAQFVGTVGIVFPYCAPLLKSLNVLARTASPTQAGASLRKDYKGLTHPDNASEFVDTYIDMLGHFAGSGAYMSYMHAAENHRSAAALMGPVPGVVAGLADDAGQAWKGTKSGKHNYAPLARDLMHYGTIPILGNYAAEREFPKKQVKPHKGRRR